ncbi:alpha-amylase family protein [Rheinheimera baltica]|uniref:alpha-amylase family protein n=1 Tax=Rheinheimera baltica TaxID=67576 RepID=UPI00273EECB8|nr:alpha-amylase family protein [Rheinheimera baltica]MDP5150685.1 alpha-amylase family protein [Rheinheimera baltica]
MQVIKTLFKRQLIRLMLLITPLLFGGYASAEAILHAFDWHYDEVAAKATEIKNLGYKAVLVAPPLKSNAANCAWWQRYQPQDIRVIDHCKGNKQSFVNMINALNDSNPARKVDVYADIVLNHMANERGGATDFPGQAALNSYSSNSSSYWNNQKLFGNLSQGLFSPWDFNPANCISNYNDVWQVQNWRLCGGAGDSGLPDLNPNNWVVQQQRAYLSALKSLGVKGFRVDAAKHMSNWHINQIFTSTIKNGMYVFGEIITSGGAGNNEYNSFLSPYLANTDHKAYDFPLFNSIRSAFGFGGSLSQLVNPAAYGQALQNNRAVTFTVTHDIPTNDGFRYLIMDPTDEYLAYAYVMGRDGGKPLIFSDSTGTDNNRWVNAYKASHISKMLNFHNRMQGQGMEMLAWNDCAILFRRGQEGVVGINKCGNSQNFNVNTNGRFYWYRNYRDALSGANLVYISGGNYTFSIPARQARMWYAD